MSIELEPASQLGFRRPLTEPIRETLIIRNPTQLPIAFKVKTTAPKQYCVRPNSGRVEAGQEQEVQVQMQAMKEEPSTDFKCKDKFMVQSIAITAERELLPPGELWPSIEREAKDQIKEKKIRCVFLPPVGHDITQIKEEEEPSSSTHSAHSTINSHSIPAPPSPALSTAAMTSTPGPETPLSMKSPTTNSDVDTLKRELDQARITIRSLQANVEKMRNEANTLRQRKPESTPLSAPGMTAVHLKHQEDGYSITFVAGAAFVAFIFAYLFF
ncbi:phosphatidylinositol-binding protein scs2 [Modicella reniformis]|uniref:Phosphatidylinositol-binding protein scs2 n=1 Tax=Modicella reniformis TaxID=1440133 RepID=A0A9P6SUN0_9FUNG|nr:phosphatidylinositol-binding protein scs2 [Modicella reniformis]